MTLEEMKREAAVSHRLLVQAITADEDKEITALADRYLKAVVNYREAVRFRTLEIRGGLREAC